MDRFLNWLRANKVALIVATAMFAVMAVVMALMLNESLMGNLGTIFSDDATKTMSPFLWAWRAGGALTRRDSPCPRDTRSSPPSRCHRLRMRTRRCRRGSPMRASRRGRKHPVPLMGDTPTGSTCGRILPIYYLHTICTNHIKK